MRTYGVPTARRHVFLDNDLDIDKISQQLEKLVKVSKKNGIAIGIGHVKPNTLKFLKKRYQNFPIKDTNLNFYLRL